MKGHLLLLILALSIFNVVRTSVAELDERIAELITMAGSNGFIWTGGWILLQVPTSCANAYRGPCGRANERAFYDGNLVILRVGFDLSQTDNPKKKGIKA